MSPENGQRLGRIAEAYYNPKPWESEGLYRALGVRKIKRLIPDAPVYHLKSLDQKGLELFEKQMQCNEKIHSLATIAVPSIGATLGTLFWLVSHEPLFIYVGAATGGIMGIIPNIPLVMIQRYNRLRIRRVLNRIKSANR